MILPALQNKRILFIVPRFFGYEQEILEEFINQGAFVDMLPDRIFDTPLMTAITKLNRELVLPFADKTYRKKIFNFARTTYDLIFVINGQTLSDRLLSQLKLSYPTAKFILYLWDSINNRPSTVKNFKYFDSIFSFDLIDAKQYNLIFRPLFFAQGFEKKNHIENQYDISFIGTIHSDRYNVISQLTKNLTGSVKKFLYLYLKAEWVFYYYKLTDKKFKEADISNFEFIPLEKKKVQNIFFSSKSILDIEHIKQTGLTIRTFETLGSEKKLVTTNPNIINYDFFRSENIFILDRKNPIIPTDFFHTPYEPLPQDLYKKYTLIGWLQDILES